MRARSSYSLIAVLGAVVACSGGGGDSPDGATPDGATIDAAAPDATPLDAPAPDAPAPDARIDAAGSDGGLDPLACGTGTPIVPLPPSGVATGTASASTPGNVSSTTCNGRGAETAYVFTVDHTVTLDATTDDPATTLDTVLYVRSACQDPTTELACADDLGATNPRSHLTVALPAGTYYLIVDGRNVGSAGAYTLSVRLAEAQGAPCTSPLECQVGYTCRAIPPATQLTCEPPVCADGRDDDGDGRTDYPADPGCASPQDDTEDDTCPAGPGCPACADGVDNDGDLLTDYPTDPGCTAASADSEESCAGETDPVAPITAGTTSGTTAGATNDRMPACVTNSTAPDRAHTLRVRYPLATLVIDTDTSPFDTVVSLLDADCAATIACDDDGGDPGNQSRISRTGVAPGTYTIVVDGFASAAGAYQLHVAGTYALGAACDPTAPYFTCGVGAQCLGPAMMEVCVATACNDAVDADGDGFPGYPTDPGCASPDDDDETDDCPSGPMCPACGNGLDDDGDGAIDYPLDDDCASASGPSEQTCAPETDPFVTITAPVTTGTTVGATNDFIPACITSATRTAPDRVHLLTLQVPVATLTLDTAGSGYDTALMFADETCAPVLACDDDAGPGTTSLLTRTAVAPGTYAVIVDGFAAAAGAYTLNVRGTLAAGASCADPLVTAGVLACPTGTTCQAGLCQP
ncbi:MAG: PPC domain-containing protein [Myxococcales bacterium]|nr:PPC domain-containing protein [Myxococcales bacterium]